VKIGSPSSFWCCGLGRSTKRHAVSALPRDTSRPRRCRPNAGW
jgi:hypothetical protein